MKRIILGAVVGVLIALGVQTGVRQVRRVRNRESDALYRWAYLKAPMAVGDGASVHTLTVDSQTVSASPAERSRGESMRRVRWFYESPDGVKMIRVICRFKDGELVSPSADELRKLDAAAVALPVSSEPLPLPK